jgi:hypothetical protein
LQRDFSIAMRDFEARNRIARSFPSRPLDYRGPYHWHNAMSLAIRRQNARHFEEIAVKIS